MRKLLIISTTFFPDPTVPAIRMTQWCRHLPEHGWKPHVICRHYGYECSAQEMAEKVHPEVTVEYLDHTESVGTAARSRWRRFVQGVMDSRLGLAGLFIPDPSIRFWRSRRQQILKRVQEIQPDVILTTSPAHSIHDIGLWLSRQTGIPWVADFRDPYLLDNRFQPRGLGLLRWRGHRRFKDAIHNSAWLVTFAIPNHARYSRRRYAAARDRMLTLTNAFPPELVDALPDSARTGGRKTVLVTGTIPEPEQLRLAQAVAQLAGEGHDVQLKLLGKRPECEPQLRVMLGERLALPGYVPHTESIRAVAQADVLVNFLDVFRSQSRLLSTKLFEYLASGNPVLCINPSRVDRLLLWRMSGVKALILPTQDELVAGLRDTLAGKVRRDPADVEQFRKEFNWPRRAAQLAEAFDRLVAFPPRELPPPRVGVLAPVASVVITTRNRRELIRQPILSALHQSVPVEVIVVDDGSTDGTADLVQAEFPQVRLIRHGESRGYIVRRNEAAKAAKADFIFSIDDDAIFSTAHVVEETLNEFNDPRIGAVAIPCVDVRKSQAFRQPRCMSGEIRATDNFIGTAHAVRRDVFLQLHGYREHLVHQGEEGDFCIRMMNAGHLVRLGGSDPILHWESFRRDFRRMDYYGARNSILFVWQNVPSSSLLIHGLATTINVLTHTFVPARFLVRLRGVFAGIYWCLSHRDARNPVAQPVYSKSRRLRRAGALPLSELEA